MSATLQIPDDVVEAVSARWPDRGQAWLEQVGGELQDLCTKYGGEPRGALSARYSFVVAVQAATGVLVMRASPDPDAAGQAEVATALGAVGLAPVTHEVLATQTGVWTIMDRVTPGCSFSEVKASDTTLDTLATDLTRMLHQPAPSEHLPALHDWLRARLLDDDLRDLAPGRQPAPLSEREEALHLLDTLVDAETVGLCHGDLSPGNVLWSNQRRFYFIDPRGVRGDAAYDIAVLAAKAPQYGPPEDVAMRLAGAVGLDAGRVREWQKVSLAARV